MNLIIKDAYIVNEGTIQVSSLHITGQRIAAIGNWKTFNLDGAQILEAEGQYLLPGVIDTHVHFREPGLTEKADFYTESRAAATGGVTSIVDMPNTLPPTTTLKLLQEKAALAQEKSLINYGFMIGAANDNISQILDCDPSQFAAIKLFLGSSTGNMLVDNPQALDMLFQNAKTLIVAHCEEEGVIQANLQNYKAQYLGTPEETTALHPKIRTTEACYLSTYKAIERARKFHTQLHIAHLTTATELNLLSNQDLPQKHITAEVSPNHLWFDDRDYERLGNLIKCNPSIKSNDDRLALWAALYDGLIDTIATDHAPHTLESKQLPYFKAPGGIPSIQHSLQMMLESVFNPTTAQETGLRDTWLPLLVQKMSHAPADRFHILDRGYLREGYYADLVLVDPHGTTTVTPESLYYKCGWSPLQGETFHTRIASTWVNGTQVWDGTRHTTTSPALPLQYTPWK